MAPTARPPVPLTALPLLLLLAACPADTAPLTPLAWQKVTGPELHGAVLGLGAPGAFDEKANFTVTAFRDGDIVRLYYGGGDATGACPGINDSHWRIGLATSRDGVTFTRFVGDQTGGSIVDNGPDGQFDSKLTYRPFVMKDGTTYRMWFNGSDHAFNCPAGELALDRHIGYAESTDGEHWVKAPYDGDGERGSVLPLGLAGSIDAQQVGYVWVIKDGAEYKMYYSANDVTNTWRVMLATSTDARHWTKHQGKQFGGAVLDIGPAGAFDSACAYQTSVVKEREDLYRMWYRGCPGPATGPSRGTIGYAESNDGKTWVKIPQPGLLGAALSQGPVATSPADDFGFDSLGLTTPSVFLDASGWNMYYAGVDTSGQFLSGLARAAP